MEKNLTLFCEKFLELKNERTPFVVVTMTNNRGDAPQEVGARMIVGPEGILFGTVGGGKIERRCLDVAQEFIVSSGKILPQSFTWNLQKDIGMSCGGEVSMFFEVERPQEEWRIAIFGAGHISQEVTRVLLRLNCQLLVVDSRKEWLDKLPESSRLKKVETTDMKSVLDQLDDGTFVASMTMGHGTDFPILQKALKERNFAFLGVIGSKVKRVRIEKELQEAGLSASRVKDFFCPMGEPIGGNAPAEIAISIVAQMLKVRDFKAESV